MKKWISKISKEFIMPIFRKILVRIKGPKTCEELQEEVERSRGKARRKGVRGTESVQVKCTPDEIAFIEIEGTEEDPQRALELVNSQGTLTNEKVREAIEYFQPRGTRPHIFGLLILSFLILFEAVFFAGPYFADGEIIEGLLVILVTVTIVALLFYLALDNDMSMYFRVISSWSIENVLGSLLIFIIPLLFLLYVVFRKEVNGINTVVVVDKALGESGGSVNSSPFKMLHMIMPFVGFLTSLIMFKKAFAFAREKKRWEIWRSEEAKKLQKLRRELLRLQKIDDEKFDKIEREIEAFVSKVQQLVNSYNRKN